MKKVIGIVFILLISAHLWGQSVSVSQINGTVRDQSGAILPGVEVKVTQTETGFSRTILSDEMGAYSLSNLPVGPYRLETSLAGFRTYVQNGIVLQVNTNPVINITLEVGSTSESIEVTADAAMVETRNNGVGTVVDERRIDDLPLNGRQVTQLIQLSGAAVPTTALGNSRVYPTAIGVSIAGGIPNGTNYVMDGAFHNDFNTNVGIPLPLPDALQEFKVETSALPARYGLHPGGTVNVVTKSGTNDFHGTLFEFVRNNSFNAINPFALHDDGLKRNQFGGTLGGPIVQNRLFFFGSYQDTIVRIEPNANQSFVPTPAMLSGDFTGIASAACNGGKAISLGAPFINNRLDPSQFSKVAVNVLKYVPISNDPCGRITYGQRGDYGEQQALGRIDFQRSGKQSMFGRYYLADYNHPVQFDGTNILQAAGNSTGLGYDSKAQAFVFGDTYTFTSALVSSFRATVNRVASIRDAGTKLPTYTSLGSNVTSLYTGPSRNFLALTMTNGFGGSGYPGFFMTNGFQLAEDVDLLHGAHQISFGANWIHAQENGLTAFPMNGGFTFNGSRTGGNRIGMADFFAGLPSEFRQAQSIVYDRMNYIGLYAQDSWKISPRMTLNAGLRWEPYFPPHNIQSKAHHFEESWFREGLTSTVFTNSPAGYLYPGDPGYPGRSNTFGRLNQFAPRLGLVIDPRGDGRQTLRASYGILRDDPIMWENSHFPLDPPWGNYVILTNPPSFENPWSSYPGGNPFPTPDPLPKNFAFPLFATYTNLPLHAKTMYMEQWNLSYQKQVGDSWLLSASYLGNRSLHVWLGHDINHATYIPGQSTTSNTNLRRKLYLVNPAQGQYYADIEQMDDGSTGSYNGMLISAQKRFSRGLSWNSNYTWSKCLNDGDQNQDIVNQYPDPDNRRTNRGPCTTNNTSIINSSVLAESPRIGSALVKKITGGWQSSTIFTFHSGDPLTATSPGDLALTGIPAQRPILVGAPNIQNPTIDRWFNTGAFAPNTPGLWGNVGRNTLRGPKFWNIDAAISRRFQIREGQRLELRAEAFNVFNHFQPGDPVAAINSANFGRIISTGQDPRIMQFAAKYIF